jgi:hypothetical protein
LSKSIKLKRSFCKAFERKWYITTYEELLHTLNMAEKKERGREAGSDGG